MDFICRSLDVKILVSKPTVEDGLLSDCGSRPSCDNFALESQVKSADVAHNCSNCSVIWSLDAANGLLLVRVRAKSLFISVLRYRYKGLMQAYAFTKFTSHKWTLLCR